MPSTRACKVHFFFQFLTLIGISMHIYTHTWQHISLALEPIKRLTILIVIFGLVISTTLVTRPVLYSMVDFIEAQFITSSSNPVLQPLFSRLLIGGNGRHQHHKLNSICNDFPPGFPPPETNTTVTICVDRNGCCNFTTLQAAVDSVVNFSSKRTVIWINSGIYYEKVIVPRSKPNITFQGQGYLKTTIAWNDTAYSTNGSFYSGSVQVFSANFIARNISFKNVAPIPKPGDVGAQAVAIRVAGDTSSFWGCGFFGSQDTLHDDKGRHYFRDCYIEGSIDFIFGDARSLYENCQLISVASPVPPGQKVINGAVTAHGRTSTDDNTGFAFANCSIGGTGRIWLGRAWGPFSRVVFASTSMTDIIAPEGWNDFNDTARDQTIFYGEYNCSGAGANMTWRAPYVERLNYTQASPFLNISFIDGDQWLQT